VRQPVLRHLLRIRDRARAEQGFTLIELLMSILIGMVVLGALFTIQIVTLHQTTSLFSKVDATSHARVGVEGIENELHSACITDKVTPILTGSTATTLMFVSQYGTGASLTPVEHQVTFSSAARTLTDATYAETGVTTSSTGAPVYTFASTATSTRTVLSNVAQTGATPVFQYFAYQAPMNGANPYTDSAGNSYMMLLDGTSVVPGTSVIPTPSPLAVPLSATSSPNAAEVMISMSVGPSGGTGENTNLSNSVDQVQDGVVLRLTPAANHAGSGAVFLPCQ
jgi:hypothetical protein